MPRTLPPSIERANESREFDDAPIDSRAVITDELHVKPCVSSFKPRSQDSNRHRRPQLPVKSSGLRQTCRNTRPPGRYLTVFTSIVVRTLPETNALRQRPKLSFSVLSALPVFFHYLAIIGPYRGNHPVLDVLGGSTQYHPCRACRFAKPVENDRPQSACSCRRRWTVFLARQVFTRRVVNVTTSVRPARDVRIYVYDQDVMERKRPTPVSPDCAEPNATDPSGCNV